MNYRHGYHAGNFADILKHMVLTYCLDYLCKKASPFYVLDTHAGKGLYDLNSHEALRTNECAEGILALSWGAPLPPLAKLYYSFLHTYVTNHLYPGSPLFISHYIRAQDRACMTELHTAEYEILQKILENKKNITVRHQDGYQSLKAFLPPMERRGLILIDPPFEKPDEFLTLLKAIKAGLKRFGHGVYVIWFPLKNQKAAQDFYEPLLVSTKFLFITYTKKNLLDSHKLMTTGLLILNPPFGLHQAVKDTVPWLEQANIYVTFETNAF